VNTEAQDKNGGKFPDFKKIFHPKAAVSQDKENLLSGYNRTNNKAKYGTATTDDPYADFNQGLV
jgi:hypothetical protein